MTQSKLRRYNADQSRKDILEAAEKHFAERGFYGARVQAIADEAGINKRMLYAYFTDKEGLYAAVLRTVYDRMAVAEQEVLDMNLEGARLIETLLDMYFEFLEANPGFVALLLWENLSKASHLSGDHEQLVIQRPTSRRLEEALLKGQAEGIFRVELDVRQTVISLITMTFANFSNRYTLSRLFDMDLSGKEAMMIRKRHTIDIVLAYIMRPE